MRAINLGILLGAGIAVVAAGACTSGGDSDPASNGSGGGSATGGGDGTGATNTGTGSTGTGTGGNGTAGGGSGDPDAVACPDAADALLLDFALGMGGGSATPSFGDFDAKFSGTTYSYPVALTSDVSGENWHISGDVADYSGFGLAFADCYKVDASAFKGIKLTISGDTGGKPITLNVGTAADQITSAWMQANGDPDAAPNFGRCTPADNQYDGTCGSPTYQITVSGTPTTVQIPWAELTGGSPDDSVDPSEITFIAWNFTPPDGVGTASVVSYPVDVVVDDIGFME